MTFFLTIAVILYHRSNKSSMSNEMTVHVNEMVSNYIALHENNRDQL